jgi:glycosyltransferase involved in cell wall biosynthesis
VKILLINTTRPEFGTGDKITEYTYQLYKHLIQNKSDSIDLLYAINDTKSSNTIGLIYTNTIFRSKIPGFANKGYDIIHITNQEVGFAAKILREAGYKGTIITTLHDTLRMRNDLHRGLRQKLYNNLTTLNIRNALETSDLIIFDDAKTRDEVREIHQIKKDIVIPLGIDDSIIKTQPAKKTKGKKFVVGYIGDSLASNKNIMLLLKVAELMKNDKSYGFEIYGSGVEYEQLNMYKISNDLDNVQFKSLRNIKSRSEIYDNFDVFVYPALGETYAQSIMEAFGRGLPVIIDSRARFIEDIKKYCITVKDENDMVKKLKKIKTGKIKLKNDESVKYSRNFSWDKTTKETYNTYKNLSKK